MERTTTETVESSGVITCRTFDVEECRRRFPGWDTWTRTQKFESIRSIRPEDVIRSTNTTTMGLQNVIATSLDTNAPSTETVTHLALGTDNTTPSSSNAALNSEVFRTSLSETAVSGGTLNTSTFVDSTEANGNTLVELGLTTGDTDDEWTLLNHSTFSSVVKDNTIVVTFDVDLTFNVA